MTAGDEAQQREIEMLRQRVAELEQQLEHQEYYRMLFEQHPIATIIYNLDGLTLDLNPQNEKIFNIPPDAVRGVFNVMTDKEARNKGFSDYFERALQGELVVMPPTIYSTRESSVEGHLIDRDVWTEASFFPLYDDAGNIRYIVETYTDISERVQAEQDLHTFRMMVENAVDGIASMDMNSHITYANPAYCRMMQCGDEVIGEPATNYYNEPPEKIATLIQEVIEEGEWQGELSYRRKNGSAFTGVLSAFSITHTQGKGPAVAGIIRDVTEQRKAEEERTTLQEQVIEAQRTALRELSSPLIPITDNVVIMPLIGTIDSGRAQQVMETLLEGVAQHKADIAILDITGVAVVDTQVANVLIQAAQAVRLLGAKVMLTGIGPSMAQTLVHLGADLSSLITRGSLQAGIATALSNNDTHL
jgi:PAS domain S-box-containing protein